MTTESLNKRQHENDDLSLRNILIRIISWVKFLLSKWILILGFALLGAGIGFMISIIKKPKYTASTTFVLEEGENGGFSNLGGLASVVGIDLGSGGGGLFSGDNILELYKSRTMIQEALFQKAKFGKNQSLLIDRYIEFNNLKSKWKDTDWTKVEFTDSAKNTVLQDSVVGEIVKEINKFNLSITKPEKKLSIIRVDMVSKDELFAKAFNDEIVSSVNKFYIETKTKRSLNNVNILQHKTDSVRAVMYGSINVAAAVSDATPNLNSSRQAQRIAPMQRSQFSAETNKAVLAELIKNLELSKMNLLRETPLIQVIDQPIYPLEKSKNNKILFTLLGFFILSCTSIVYLTVKRILSTL